MKSQQPKEAATAKSAGGQPAVSPSIKQKGMVLTSDHREQSLEHWPRPSELELANLAARLARAEKIDPKQLVKEAHNPRLTENGSRLRPSLEPL